MSFRTIFRELLDIPGTRAVALLDLQGEVIDSLEAGASRNEIETFGAHQGIWMNMLSNVTTKGDLGDLTDVTMEFDRRRLLASRLGEGYYLFILLDGDGEYAPVRARLGSVRQRLAAELV